jgi:hypothetical protein
MRETETETERAQPARSTNQPTTPSEEEEEWAKEEERPFADLKYLSLGPLEQGKDRGSEPYLE